MLGFGALASRPLAGLDTAYGGTWNNVAWSPQFHLLIAVGDNGIMTSPDGAVWTSRAVPAANNWSGLSWAAELNLFAAVAQTGSGNRVMISADGLIWTAPLNVANYEANRRLALFSTERAIYNTPLDATQFAMIPLRILDPVEIQMDRFGFGAGAGRTLRIIGYTLNLADATVDLTLWG